MNTPRMISIALMTLAPSMALAHGSDGHAADPNLHVNPDLKDCSVQFAPELTQDAFARFVREFGSTSAFKMMAPPTPLGRGHVAVGLEGISFTVEEKADAWNDTFYHPDATHELGAKKQFPKLRLAVGVTDRLDLGAFYTENPNANYGWLGFEARYGLLRQSDARPVSLALRGAYTKTLYVDDMDMHALTADVAAGRTFWSLLTPYVGVGGDLVMARETSAAVDLNTEYQPVSHAFAGLEFRLGHVAFGGEVSQAALASYQLHLTALF
jgi:hypothetical protein